MIVWICVSAVAFVSFAAGVLLAGLFIRGGGLTERWVVGKGNGGVALVRFYGTAKAEAVAHLEPGDVLDIRRGERGDGGESGEVEGLCRP